MKKMILYIATLLFTTDQLPASPLQPDAFEKLFLDNIKDGYLLKIKDNLGLSDQHELDEAKFEKNFGMLIEQVDQLHKTNRYDINLMDSFLVVAMARKFGMPNESYTDLKKAASLFTLVMHKAKSESLRGIAERSLQNCPREYKPRLVRSKTI